MVARQVPRVLADRVREARLLLGLTQSELASALEVSVRSVQLWESEAGSQPQARHLRRLAELSQRTVPWFYGEEAA